MPKFRAIIIPLDRNDEDEIYSLHEPRVVEVSAGELSGSVAKELGAMVEIGANQLLHDMQNPREDDNARSQ